MVRRMMSEHYVYIHKDNDDIVYCGKGKNGRAWHIDRPSEDHKSLLTYAIHSDTADDVVEIIQGHLTSTEAYALESEVISEFQPKYNTESSMKYCPHCEYSTWSAGGLASHLRCKH